MHWEGENIRFIIKYECCTITLVNRGKRWKENIIIIHNSGKQQHFGQYIFFSVLDVNDCSTIINISVSKIKSKSKSLEVMYLMYIQIHDENLPPGRGLTPSGVWQPQPGHWADRNLSRSWGRHDGSLRLYCTPVPSAGRSLLPAQCRLDHISHERNTLHETEQHDTSEQNNVLSFYKPP